MNGLSGCVQKAREQVLDMHTCSVTAMPRLTFGALQKPRRHIGHLQSVEGRGIAIGAALELSTSACYFTLWQYTGEPALRWVYTSEQAGRALSFLEQCPPYPSYILQCC